MASFMEKYELAQQEYLKEKQEGEASSDTICHLLEMGLRAYEEWMTQQRVRIKEEEILEDQMVFVQQEETKQEAILKDQMNYGKKKLTVRAKRIIQKKENKIQSGSDVRKLQKMGKQNKKGKIERQGGRKHQSEGKSEQRREEGLRSLEGGLQNDRKILYFKDNG